MALPDISLAQFNRIASGSYNAGQIDFQTTVRMSGKAARRRLAQMTPVTF